MALSVTPLGDVGVEVSGFDITQAYTEPLKEELRSLWYEHGLLLFRNQPINPENQIEFSRVFGALEMHPLKVTTSDEYPELFELVNGGDRDEFISATYHGEKIVGRLDWHVDLQYTARTNHGAVLTAVEVAAEDGLTGFGDLAKAYDALDDDTKMLLEKIEVVYTFMMQRKYWRFVDLEGYEPNPNGPKNPSDARFPDFSEVAYPAAINHPVTNRKVLTVVEQFLDRVANPHNAGLSYDESIDLLHRLVAHVKKPEFLYYHQWREGDMVLWDNWRFMHCATGTKPGVRRVINRTTIEGGATLGRVLVSGATDTGR
jgi:taurine dioxygenase